MRIVGDTVADTITMDLSIFKAFDFAIISDVWQIGTCQHGGVVGNVFNKVADLDVIIDEENYSTINSTPETINSGMLVYCKPEQMPTLNTNELVSNYMLYDADNDYYYSITFAGIGKNQHKGVIEHVELTVVQTEAMEPENDNSN